MLDLRVEFPDSCFVSASVGTGFEQIWTKHLHLRFVGSSMCEPCLRGDPCQLVQAACSNGNSCIYTCTMGLQKGHLRQHTDFKYTSAGTGDSVCAVVYGLEGSAQCVWTCHYHLFQKPLCGNTSRPCAGLRDGGGHLAVPHATSSGGFRRVLVGLPAEHMPGARAPEGPQGHQQRPPRVLGRIALH